MSATSTYFLNAITTLPISILFGKNILCINVEFSCFQIQVLCFKLSLKSKKMLNTKNYIVFSKASLAQILRVTTLNYYYVILTLNSSNIEIFEIFELYLSDVDSWNKTYEGLMRSTSLQMFVL